MKHEHPRIAVLVDTSTGWGRRVIRGISSYGLKYGPWQLLVEEYGMEEPMQLQSGWKGDGIIARVTGKGMFTELISTGRPVVNVSGIHLDGVDLPQVTTDYDAVAKLAVQHFTERGFRNVAYCSRLRRPYVQRHAKAFSDAAKKAHLEYSVLQGSRPSWSAERDELIQWLKELPKPVGILTWGTRRGRDIINACQENGIPVPDSVAVLAGDDDDLLCEVSYPPLSGIIAPAEQIGYEAARILHMQLKGKRPPAKSKLIPPTGVHTRLSTDTLAITDSVIAEAVQYIREHAHTPIQVSDVADAVHLSRRTLERSFKTALGCSPAVEIQRNRLQRAQKLLKDTDMPIADVAAVCGFGSSEYMIKVFQKATGHTPLKYRTWVKAR